MNKIIRAFDQRLDQSVKKISEKEK
jgi:hypothetical protein